MKRNKKKWSVLLFIAFGCFLFVWGVWKQHLYDCKVAYVHHTFLRYVVAVSFYYDKFKVLPFNKDQLLKGDDKRLLEQTIFRIDPWGNPYKYILVDKKKYKILCLGSDGKEGGSGTARDIERIIDFIPKMENTRGQTSFRSRKKCQAFWIPKQYPNSNF